MTTLFDPADPFLDEQDLARNAHAKTAADKAAFERIPPQDGHAEKCVIGGMLLSKDAITEVAEILQPTDYYRPANGIIHKAILRLYAAGEPADPITVSGELDKVGDLTRVGGDSYLHECVAATPTAANAGWHAALVRRKAVLRLIIETGTALVGIGYDPSAGEADEALEAAAARMQALTAGGVSGISSREHPLSQVLDNTMAAYHSNGANHLPLPYKDLAEMCPMEPGEFVIVAASPGMGKTTVLTDIARHVAIKHGGGAYIGSMEMPHTQIGQRILCAEARVNLTKFRKHTLTPEELARVNETDRRIRDYRLIVDDSTAVPVSRMRTRLRQMQAAGELPDVWIIDYLQIAKAEAAEGANRTIAVDGLARAMRDLAMDFEIVVMAAAQLSRKPNDRIDKTPLLSDLRESGGIEQAATIALLLHREEYYDKETQKAGEMEIHVAKNRMGPTGIVTVAYQGHYCRAKDLGSGF